MFFVAEIQRQIVLKFKFFQMNSFEDIIVGSCRRKLSSSVAQRPASVAQRPASVAQRPAFDAT